MKETNVLHLVMLAVSKAGSMVFRNNVALAAAGRIEWVRTTRRVIVEPGDAVVRNARPLRAGLCKGSGDVIGGTPLTITPEMVGRTVLVFTSLEVKTERGRAATDQVNFADRVRRAGGISGFVRSPEEAVALVKGEFGS